MIRMGTLFKVPQSQAKMRPSNTPAEWKEFGRIPVKEHGGYYMCPFPDCKRPLASEGAISQHLNSFHSDWEGPLPFPWPQSMPASGSTLRIEKGISFQSQSRQLPTCQYRLHNPEGYDLCRSTDPTSIFGRAKNRNDQANRQGGRGL